MVPSGGSRARAKGSRRLRSAAAVAREAPRGSHVTCGGLRPSQVPGLARQRGHDEEAVQSHAPAGQPDGGQVGHPLAAAAGARLRGCIRGRPGDGARRAS